VEGPSRCRALPAGADAAPVPSEPVPPGPPPAPPAQALQLQPADALAQLLAGLGSLMSGNGDGVDFAVEPDPESEARDPSEER
jgi:hypothetical protein